QVCLINTKQNVELAEKVKEEQHHSLISQQLNAERLSQKLLHQKKYRQELESKCLQNHQMFIYIQKQQEFLIQNDDLFTKQKEELSHEECIMKNQSSDLLKKFQELRLGHHSEMNSIINNNSQDIFNENKKQLQQLPVIKRELTDLDNELSVKQQENDKNSDIIQHLNLLYVKGQEKNKQLDEELQKEKSSEKLMEDELNSKLNKFTKHKDILQQEISEITERISTSRNELEEAVEKLNYMKNENGIIEGRRGERDEQVNLLSSKRKHLNQVVFLL
ncbi:unnamed protein product, partial [Meganyctiphanes norvegica]